MDNKEIVNEGVIRLFGISFCRNPLEALIKYNATPEEWEQVRKIVEKEKKQRKK